MDRPPGTVRSRVASGVAKLRARRAAGRQSGINNTRLCGCGVLSLTERLVTRLAFLRACVLVSRDAYTARPVVLTLSSGRVPVSVRF